jgi:hypothetical protein
MGNDPNKEFVFMVVKPDFLIQMADRLTAFRIMPRCENFQKLEENDECVKYACKGHYLNTHGDPLRENRFWVYPATMRPFNLGKGDYRAHDVDEVCSRYKRLGTTEFQCMGHDNKGDLTEYMSFHGDPQNDHKYEIAEE